MCSDNLICTILSRYMLIVVELSPQYKIQILPGQSVQLGRIEVVIGAHVPSFWQIPTPSDSILHRFPHSHSSHSSQLGGFVSGLHHPIMSHSPSSPFFISHESPHSHLSLKNIYVLNAKLGHVEYIV